LTKSKDKLELKYI